MTYPLGWSVITQMLIRRERWPGGYKTRGFALVYPGQEVQPDQPVIRLNKPEGARPGSQQMGETVLAGMYGRVIDITRRGGVIIETNAAIVQGAIGAGNQVAGILTTWDIGSRFPTPGTTPNPSNQPSEVAASHSILPGAILVVPGPLNFAMLRQAINSGAVGIVASSISSSDLEAFLRTNLISLINSINLELAQANLPSITLLFTEGLGTIPMPARTINLLSHYQGSIALISGATSIRHSIYPELIISLPARDAQPSIQPSLSLSIGALVRVCSGDHEGAIGKIDHLFIHQQLFVSGVRARAARIRLEDGSAVIIPLTLIERIG